MSLLTKRLLALLAALVMLAAACGGDSSDDYIAADTGDEDGAMADDAMDDEGHDDDAMDDEGHDDDAMDEGAAAMPGEGVSVVMGRANWSTGYVQAEIYKDLLEELGYEVGNPADNELAPSLGYLAMAQGEFDFWVNGWFPGHNSWLEKELPDGSKVGDHLSVVGEQMLTSGLQGYLGTKTFMDEHDVKTIDDINNNPEILAVFDATDTNPDNGKADIYGCPEDWTCDDIISSQIAFSGWENIDQVLAGYDAMIAEAIDKANSGVPMVIYTWAPSAYVAELRAGDNVMWIGVEEVIDDSNPLGREGGAEWDQRPGTGAIGPDQCPMAADGECKLGFTAADIQVAANNDFLDANPAAKVLFEAVVLPAFDIALANVDQAGGAEPTDLAEQWIADNRDVVDGWLEAARAAA